MTDAQNWLNNTIPRHQRGNIQELHIFHEDSRSRSDHREAYQNIEHLYYFSSEGGLIGTLNVSTFPQLRNLSVNRQFITRLDLTNCQYLESLNANENYLKEVIWPEQSPWLEAIYLSDNNFPAQDLSFFTNFPRLKCLFLGTSNENRIIANIYNRWNGSLSFLKDLNELQELDINATDVDDGLIDLPTDKLFNFTFGNYGRQNAGVDRLKEVLVNEIEIELNEGETMEDWARKGTDTPGSIFDDALTKIGDICEWQVKQEEFFSQIQSDTNRNN